MPIPHLEFIFRRFAVLDDFLFHFNSCLPYLCFNANWFTIYYSCYIPFEKCICCLTEVSIMKNANALIFLSLVIISSSREFIIFDHWKKSWTLHLLKDIRFTVRNFKHNAHVSLSTSVTAIYLRNTSPRTIVKVSLVSTYMEARLRGADTVNFDVTSGVMVNGSELVIGEF